MNPVVELRQMIKFLLDGVDIFPKNYKTSKIKLQDLKRQVAISLQDE